MDPRNDIREFLISRRSRILPDQAGLPAYGGNRRVKGLRREEVALLAGISAESARAGGRARRFRRCPRLHRTGVKRFHHPVVGELTLDFEMLELSGDPGQKMLLYSAEPGSPSRDRLNLLASWATTPTEPRRT